MSKYQDLINEIVEADKRYYVDDDPIMTDFQYDTLVREVLKMEKDMPPEAIAPNSPSVRVAGTASTKFNQVTHSEKMYSIDNVMNLKELYSWLDSVESDGAEHTYSVEAKMDGLALSIIYINGILALGATRGNGLVGEDVTKNVKTIRTIPLKIDEGLPYQNFEVRGEVVISKTGLQVLNKVCEMQGVRTFANCRNAAAGSLRLLDSSVTSRRPLKFYAYDLIIPGKELSYEEKFDLLTEMGIPHFKVFPKLPCFTSKRVDILDRIMMLAQRSGRTGEDVELLDIDIDGVVIKVNEPEERKKLGYTSRAPRWAVAYKFKPEEAQSELVDVEYQVSRNGVVTPVAVFEPVDINGAIVSKAALHNANHLSKLNLRLGDVLTIVRSGDVIPKIIGSSASDDSHGGIIGMPDGCPCCGYKLEVSDSKTICPNKSGCPDQLSAYITHFVSKECANVVGVGPFQIEKILENYGITGLHELFQITESDLQNTQSFSGPRCASIVKAFMESRKIPLANLLFGLSISGVGKNTAHTLASYFKTMGNIRKASKEELVKVVGSVTGGNVWDWFHESVEQTHRVDLLLDELIVMDHEEGTKQAWYSGKVISITGTFNTPRSELIKTIKDHGGIVGGISSKCDMVLVGDNPSTGKLAKIEALKLPIIHSLEQE